MTFSSTLLRDADEIESFFFDMTGMKPGYFQLSRGITGLSVESIELSGVSLAWSRSPARVRWHDEMTGDDLHLGLALECAGSITAYGRDIGPRDAQVWIPGKEMDVVINGPYLSLDVGVDHSLISELGWQVTGDPLHKVPGCALSRLVEVCKSASRTVKAADNNPDIVETAAVQWRDRILDAMESVLQPWIIDSNSQEIIYADSTGAYRLIRRADEIFEGLGYGDPFNVDLIVNELGVSRRTVFYAYRKLLGIGPRRYFELRRLHYLRTRLRHASHSDATVATFATESGFGDLGRLAGLYHAQFGEYPSDTLKSS